MSEYAAYFRPAGLDGIEALHARFVRHAYRPHSHPTWTVAVVERGAARFTVDATDQRAGSGELFVLEPRGRPHRHGRGARGLAVQGALHRARPPAVLGGARRARPAGGALDRLPRPGPARRAARRPSRARGRAARAGGGRGRAARGRRAAAAPAARAAAPGRWAWRARRRAARRRPPEGELGRAGAARRAVRGRGPQPLRARAPLRRADRPDPACLPDQPAHRPRAGAAGRRGRPGRRRRGVRVRRPAASDPNLPASRSA